MSTNYTCGECRYFALNKCTKKVEQRAKINCACKSFELADETDCDLPMPVAVEAPKMPTKVCKACGRELPLDQFQINWKSADGHLGTCSECMAEKKKEGLKKRRIEDPDKLAERIVDSAYKRLQENYDELWAKHNKLDAEHKAALKEIEQLKAYNNDLMNENLQLAVNGDRSVDQLIAALRDKGCIGHIEKPVTTYETIEL